MERFADDRYYSARSERIKHMLLALNSFHKSIKLTTEFERLYQYLI